MILTQFAPKIVLSLCTILVRITDIEDLLTCDWQADGNESKDKSSASDFILSLLARRGGMPVRRRRPVTVTTPARLGAAIDYVVYITVSGAAEREMDKRHGEIGSTAWFSLFPSVVARDDRRAKDIAAILARAERSGDVGRLVLDEAFRMPPMFSPQKCVCLTHF